MRTAALALGLALAGCPHAPVVSHTERPQPPRDPLPVERHATTLADDEGWQLCPQAIAVEPPAVDRLGPAQSRCFRAGAIAETTDGGLLLVSESWDDAGLLWYGGAHVEVAPLEPPITTGPCPSSVTSFRTDAGEPRLVAACSGDDRAIASVLIGTLDAEGRTATWSTPTHVTLGTDATIADLAILEGEPDRLVLLSRRASESALVTVSIGEDGVRDDVAVVARTTSDFTGVAAEGARCLWVLEQIERPRASLGCPPGAACPCPPEASAQEGRCSDERAYCTDGGEVATRSLLRRICPTNVPCGAPAPR